MRGSALQAVLSLQAIHSSQMIQTHMPPQTTKETLGSLHSAGPKQGRRELRLLMSSYAISNSLWAQAVVNSGVTRAQGYLITICKTLKRRVTWLIDVSQF